MVWGHSTSFHLYPIHLDRSFTTAPLHANGVVALYVIPFVSHPFRQQIPPVTPIPYPRLACIEQLAPTLLSRSYFLRFYGPVVQMDQWMSGMVGYTTFHSLSFQFHTDDRF
ncbi:hypothetical protein AVEN_56839-1 [Araneus ventricosus]|uniref:Uncharacterized protein n=1 Tax=Araneus ventricosus TaxID=182803 RepID=A0A4Y2TYX6_ARAVE|nr:hypothetical protein AVEN_242358-1 [Araneus ventricosus]GBO05830.1 hypothetical protein AVEN_56839-1 [Araneus ventricosus]